MVFFYTLWTVQTKGTHNNIIYNRFITSNSIVIKYKLFIRYLFKLPKKCFYLTSFSYNMEIPIIFLRNKNTKSIKKNVMVM